MFRHNPGFSLSLAVAPRSVPMGVPTTMGTIDQHAYIHAGRQTAVAAALDNANE